MDTLALEAKKILTYAPIVPVAVFENAKDALGVAEALFDGGVSIIEVTLRTDAALSAMESIAKGLPEMRLGAGTVCTFEEMKRAQDAGAAFSFSPGISMDLMTASKDLNMPLIPGVATASEVMFAMTQGLQACKLFPATAVGGVTLLKAFLGPFSTMQFCPTGGINRENMQMFLNLENVSCVGGSWMLSKTALAKGDYDAIRSEVRDSLAQLR